MSVQSLLFSLRNCSFFFLHSFLFKTLKTLESEKRTHCFFLEADENMFITQSHNERNNIWFWLSSKLPGLVRYMQHCYFSCTNGLSSLTLKVSQASTLKRSGLYAKVSYEVFMTLLFLPQATTILAQEHSLAITIIWIHSFK